MYRDILCAGIFAVALLVPRSLHAQTATPVWSSGFENGFPGEFLNYENGWSPSGDDIPGRTSSWTIIDSTSGEPLVEGDHAYRARIVQADSTNHRAYPNLHTSIPSPYVNSFMVYLDANYAELTPSDWISFATWSNDPNWLTLATFSLRDRKIEMAHVDWEYVGPMPQPDVPLRQWIRFTAYIDHTSGGEIAIWQDGVLVIRGIFHSNPDDRLLRAHWGLYTNPGVSQATMYNDDIQIWTLSEPLQDFTDEPPSPYGPYAGGVVDPGPGVGPGSGGSGPGVDAGSGGGGGVGELDGGVSDGTGGGALDGSNGATGCDVARGTSSSHGALPAMAAPWLIAAALLLLRRTRRAR